MKYSSIIAISLKKLGDFKVLRWKNPKWFASMNEMISLQRMADMKKRTDDEKQRDMAFFVSDILLQQR